MTQNRKVEVLVRSKGVAFRRAAVTSAVATIVLGGTVALAGASGAQLLKANIKSYNGVLENTNHHTYYALTAEKGGKIHCKTSCETLWIPFLVKNSVTRISLGAGVAGKIGFVKRTVTLKQVTFNGYPIYKFSGDSGPNQSNGEAVAADGGTWYLANAAAGTVAKTMITVASKGVTTTSGGYNY